MNTNETVVVPPWIKLTQDQRDVYSRLRAYHQLFLEKMGAFDHVHDANADVVDDCLGDAGANSTDGGGGGRGACRILTLLRTRELVGSTTSSRRRGAYSPCVCGGGARDGKGMVTPTRLAKVGAW